tara:strand:+ start:3117 stop:3533 length:417 start_codon:yes stop_codon:yes gene_type:complete
MKNLVAVYGSLRKDMANHDLLKGRSTYMGKFDTNPVFDMYGLGRFPGLVKGTTSILMEVYKVNDAVLSEIDELEGYHPNSVDSPFYKRVNINTSYGLAYTYLYQSSIINAPKVLDGDWKNFYEQNVSLRKLLENAEII